MPSIYHQQQNRPQVDYGKNLCLSIPYHKLHLINKMDRRANETNAPSRSHYVRRLIEEDIRNSKKEVSVNVMQFA